MKNRLLTLATLITVSTFVVSCGGGEAVDLKLNVAKGDKFKSVLKMDQKITTSAMGMNMNIDQNLEIYQSLTVEDVNANGDVAFESVMDRFYMKQSMPMMGMPVNVEFDTDKPEKAGAMGESMRPYFAKMKNLTYKMQMDSRGRLIKSNMAEVYEKLGLDSLSRQGGSNNNTSTAGQYMSQLPEKPVKKGDTYTVEVKPSDLSPMGMTNTYKIMEVTADKVVMELKSEFMPSAKVNDIDVDIKGGQTGTVEIDRKTGMTLKSDLTQNIDMTIVSMGMKVPMKTSSTVVFTCQKQ